MSTANNLPRTLSAAALLVLDRVPLRVTGHQLTSCVNSMCRRRSPLSSGWNDARTPDPAGRTPARLRIRRGPRHRGRPARALRRTDEHTGERTAADAPHRKRRLERFALAAVAVAARRYVEHPERLPGRPAPVAHVGREEDEPRAGAERGHAVARGAPGGARADPTCRADGSSSWTHRRGARARRQRPAARGRGPLRRRRRAPRAPHDARGTLPGARGRRTSPWPGGRPSVRTTVALTSRVRRASHRACRSPRHASRRRGCRDTLATIAGSA